MPDWANELLKDLLAPTGIIALAFAWWFRTRREDKKERAKAEEDRRQAEMNRLREDKRTAEERAEKYLAGFQSVLVDAKAKAEEDHAERAERLAADRQLVALITAMTAALDRASAINARLLKDGT